MIRLANENFLLDNLGDLQVVYQLSLLLHTPCRQNSNECSKYYGNHGRKSKIGIQNDWRGLSTLTGEEVGAPKTK